MVFSCCCCLRLFFRHWRRCHWLCQATQFAACPAIVKRVMRGAHVIAAVFFCCCLRLLLLFVLLFAGISMALVVQVTDILVV